MKKKTLQRTMALALTGVMAMGALAGCGNSSSESTSTPAADTSTDTTSADTTSADTDATDATDETDATDDAVAGIEGWTPFAENVSIDIPVYDRGVEGVPDVSNNYWTQWVQENFGDAYNITVNYVPITRTDVLTDYALLAAADDLPTILMEYDFPKLAQWADDGYLVTYDLDEFAQIAPTYYNKMSDLGLLSYTELNGDCYFALAERPYYNTNYTWITWYRQDWLEQLGYDEYPASWAEQKEMLQAIIDAGLSEHPLGGAMVTGAGVDQNYAYRTYPQDELEWAMYGDYAIPALSSDANRALLKRVNEQYNLGFINPEYYVTDFETDKAAFVNGETLQYAGYTAANVDFLSSFYEQNPDAKLGVIVADGLYVDEEGGTSNAFRPTNPFGMMIGFSSQATEEEIKAAMMYMEWMSQEDNLFTMQYGIEGENFNYDENGDPVSVGDYSGDYTQGYANSKDYWCVVVEARSLGSVEQDIAAISPQGLPQDFTQDIIDNYYGQVAIYDAGYANFDCNFAVAIDAVTEYQATLLSLYTEYRDQLTMCAPEEFDALYDELSQKYLEAGYQAVIDERKEAYEAGQSTKLQ